MKARSGSAESGPLTGAAAVEHELAVFLSMTPEQQREYMARLPELIAAVESGADYHVTLGPQPSRAKFDRTLRLIRVFGHVGAARRLRKSPGVRHVSRSRSSRARRPGHRRVRTTRAGPDDDPPAALASSRGSRRVSDEARR